MSLEDVMSHAGLAGYAQIALVLFVLAFVAVVARVFWPGRRDEMRRASRLPFEDEPPRGGRPGEPQ